MNINSNELLLLNKKIRFGEEAGANEGNNVTVEEPETLTPQASMKALMFKGLNNVVSNPALATSLNVMKDVEPDQEGNNAEKEYVVPFKSNIAFQGKASKAKSIALAALMGLASLTTVTSLTSCKEEIVQEVTVDFSAITELVAQLSAIMTDMKNQQQITNQQLAQMNQYMFQLLDEVKQGNISSQQFYERMFAYMIENNANQEIIIDQLVNNGMTQAKANELIQNLIDQVKAGQISAEAALNQIKDLLSDIKGLLQDAINSFNKYFEEMLAKQDEQIGAIKQGFDQLNATGEINNSLLETIIEQNEELQELNRKEIEAANNIKQAIEKSNLDNNANFEKVISTLGVNKDEIIAVLTKLGYDQAEIIKMTAGEIKAAIDENTKATQGTNDLLSFVVKELRILPKLLKESAITNSQLRQISSTLTSKLDSLIDEVQSGNISANQFYAQAIELLIGSTENQKVIISVLVDNGMKQDEANNLIKTLISEVRSGKVTAEEAWNKITNLLGDIKDLITDAISMFAQYLDEIKANQDKQLVAINKGFDQLNSTGQITNSLLETVIEQNEELQALSRKQIEAAKDIKNAIKKANLDSNANFEKVISTLGASKDEIIKTLMKMGYTQAQILQMTAGQIISAIDENTEVTKGTNDLLAFVTKQLHVLPELLKQSKITNTQLKQLTSALSSKLDSLIAEVQNGNISASEFYAQSIDLMLGSVENQQVIISILVDNGMKQDEANKLIKDLISEVKSGKISASEAWDEIINLLGDIKSLISDAIATFSQYFEEMIQKQNELKASIKEGTKQLNNNGKITNALLTTIAKQNEDLKLINIKQIEATKEIKNAIVKANLDSNANFDKVVSTLGANKDEMIATLMKMGYTQAQVQRMTAAQITSAIDKNTAAVERGNVLLGKMSKYVSLMPELLKQNKITNAQMQEFFNLYEQALASGGAYADETLAKLEQMISKLDNIEGVLNEIAQTLNTLSDNFNTFVGNYESDKKKEFGYYKELIKNNKFQSSVLANMSKTQQSMAKNLNSIDSNVKELLEIAKDDTKFNELMEAVKNIKAGGMTNADYKRLEAMFNKLGISITQAVGMSSAQIQQTIKNFQNTYIKTETAQSKQLADISKKLDGVMFLNGLNKNEIVKAINNLTTAVNNGTEDVTAELKAIESAIDQLQATVNAIYASIGSAASKFDTYFKKWDAKFNAALGSLDHIESQLSTIIANQKTSKTYLNSMLNEIKNVKAAIEDLKNAAGDGVDYDKLDEMWKEHDAANYAKYSQLIKDLGIDLSKLDSIEDLLKSIDSKMSYIQRNSELLGQILDKLSGLDLTNQQLTEIKELLKNFKCNCECGKSNEGVLGDLDKILG